MVKQRGIAKSVTIDAVSVLITLGPLLRKDDYGIIVFVGNRIFTREGEIKPVEVPKSDQN